MNKIAKFDFKGFKLLKANLSHVKDIQVTSFSLVARKANYSEENHIYEIISEITFNFDDEVNACLFSAGFLIHDLEWLEIMAEETVVNELFKIAYPYFRAKVTQFTEDFRQGFLLPVIDFEKFDITKKMVFNLNKPEKMTS
jgi:hypothetical protein